MPVSDEVQGIRRVELHMAGKDKAALRGFRENARHHEPGGTGLNNQLHIDEQTERDEMNRYRLSTLPWLNGRYQMWMSCAVRRLMGSNLATAEIHPVTKIGSLQNPERTTKPKTLRLEMALCL